MTVVIADDNEAYRGGVVRAMRRTAGLELLAAVADGFAAMEAARRFDPDVLVVDDRMPGLSGIAVAELVTRDAALANVRVLLLSANTDPSLIKRAHDAGAVGCVDKALSRDGICAAVLAAARQ